MKGDKKKIAVSNVSSIVIMYMKMAVSRFLQSVNVSAPLFRHWGSVPDILPLGGVQV